MTSLLEKLNDYTKFTEYDYVDSDKNLLINFEDTIKQTCVTIQ